MAENQAEKQRDSAAAAEASPESPRPKVQRDSERQAAAQEKPQAPAEPEAEEPSELDEPVELKATKESVSVSVAGVHCVFESGRAVVTEAQARVLEQHPFVERAD